MCCHYPNKFRKLNIKWIVKFSILGEFFINNETLESALLLNERKKVAARKIFVFFQSIRNKLRMNPSIIINWKKQVFLNIHFKY